MFLGEYRHSIDSKDRLTVPARFRELMSEGAFIVRGFDRNLMVLTTKAFEALSHTLTQMNFADPLTRKVRRLLIADASRLDIDKAGRILIPEYLAQMAGLSSNQEAVLVGQGEYFEIWSHDEWALEQQALADPEANSERFKVLDLSIKTG